MVKWDEAEELFIINNYLTMTYRRMATKLGRSHKSVRRKVEEMRLEKKGRWHTMDTALLLQCKNMPIEQIQKFFPGRSVNAIMQKLKDIL